MEAGFYYVYPRRQNAPNLVYAVEHAAHLDEPVWTNAFCDITGTGVWAGAEGFDAVTNRVSLDVASNQFLRLLISDILH